MILQPGLDSGFQSATTQSEGTSLTELEQMERSQVQDAQNSGGNSPTCITLELQCNLSSEDPHPPSRGRAETCGYMDASLSLGWAFHTCPGVSLAWALTEVQSPS